MDRNDHWTEQDRRLNYAFFFFFSNLGTVDVDWIFFLSNYIDDDNLLIHVTLRTKYSYTITHSRTVPYYGYFLPYELVKSA